MDVIGATERKREKLTLGWRGATTRLPDVMFVEEPPAPSVAHIASAAAPVLRIDPWTKPDPVDLCLELWKNWMPGDSARDLGAKTMGGLCGEGDAHGVDLHEAQQANDIRIAQATNAAIDSMTRLHVWAIYRTCSSASVWRVPSASMIDVAAEASAELAVKLRSNICTALLFA